MNFTRKNNKFKIILSLGITLLMILTLTKTIISKSDNTNEYFTKFMDLYNSKNIDEANNYILDYKIPNINDLFSTALSNTSDNYHTVILLSIENIIHSINYEIISSKTFLNKSTLNIKFSYYDVGKHIIDFLKNNADTQNTYENLILSLKNTNCKLYTNLDIKMVKKNNQWQIIMSEKLLNILTSGLYKNFVI